MATIDKHLIKVVELKAKSKRFKGFKDYEWELINPEHYGKPLDWTYWKAKYINLMALKNKEIVGALTGELMAGVLYIPEIIVKHGHLDNGIGRQLLRRAEKWTQSNSGHGVYLVTGKNWEANKFYQKLGYELTGNLPNHYSKIDFVLFRKSII